MPDLEPRIVWENKQVRVVCLWHSYMVRDDGNYIAQPNENPDMYKRQLVIEENKGLDAMLDPIWKPVDISTKTYYLVFELANAIANFIGIPEQVNVNKG